MRYLFVVVLISVGSIGYADTNDPFENLNRKTSNFNHFVDQTLVKPIASGYSKATPGPIGGVISNFFGNISDVTDCVNNLLQGKPGAAINDLLRVSVNSTIGVGGLFDPASKLGLVDHQEDFGQTLAKWGVPEGPYLVLPFLGPSNLRNTLSLGPNVRTRPLIYLHPVNHRNTLLGVRLLHERSELFVGEEAVFGDRYIFIREAYQQRRHYLETDGEVEDLFEDEF